MKIPSLIATSWMGLIAITNLSAIPSARADGTTGDAPLVADPVTAALVDATLRQPGVANAVHAGAVEGDATLGAPAPGASPRPMIELGTRTPAPPPPPVPPAEANPRSDRHVGVDFRVGAPLGVGAEIRYTIVAPITVGAAIDTNAATYAVTAEATVNILPIFMNSHWTPTVTVSFTHIRFTGLADSAIRSFNPYLAQQNVDVHMAGTWMNAVSVLGGIDYVSDGGFHFNISAGRIMQVGDSGGGDANGTVIRGFHSLMVQVALGYQF